MDGVRDGVLSWAVFAAKNVDERNSERELRIKSNGYLPQTAQTPFCSERFATNWLIGLHWFPGNICLNGITVEFHNFGVSFCIIRGFTGCEISPEISCHKKSFNSIWRGEHIEGFRTKCLISFLFDNNKNKIYISRSHWTFVAPHS